MNARIRLAATALAAGTALTLSGCGSADTAAVVDGATISEDGARTAAQQVNEAFNPETPLTTGSVVNQLVLAPFVLDAVAADGKPATEAAAREALADVVDPAPETVELMRLNQAFSSMSQESAQGALEAMQEADITVSPRYGTFNATDGTLKAATPNWLVPSTAEATDETQQQ
ncbi:hypothetical protein [Janibacter sp. G1551]|uniref:hypothetical protein n=1 Tax=Janibacter sp. G1551 TaxID=3420440 RepID=UPI003D06C6A3